MQLDLQAELVGRAVDFEPAAGVGLVLADLVADFGMENLRPAAGQAAEAGFDHVLEHLSGRGFLVSRQNQSISTGVQAFRCSSGIGLVQDAG